MEHTNFIKKEFYHNDEWCCIKLIERCVSVKRINIFSICSFILLFCGKTLGAFAETDYYFCCVSCIVSREESCSKEEKKK